MGDSYYGIAQRTRHLVGMWANVLALCLAIGQLYLCVRVPLGGYGPCCLAPASLVNETCYREVGYTDRRTHPFSQQAAIMCNRLVLFWIFVWFAAVPLYRMSEWDKDLRVFISGCTMFIVVIGICISTVLLGTSAALECTDGSGWYGLMVIDRIEFSFLPTIAALILLERLVTYCVRLWTYTAYTTIGDLNTHLVDRLDGTMPSRIDSSSSESSEEIYNPTDEESL